MKRRRRCRRLIVSVSTAFGRGQVIVRVFTLSRVDIRTVLGFDRVLGADAVCFFFCFLPGAVNPVLAALLFVQVLHFPRVFIRVSQVSVAQARRRGGLPLCAGLTRGSGLGGDGRLRTADGGGRRRPGHQFGLHSDGQMGKVGGVNPLESRPTGAVLRESDGSRNGLNLDRHAVWDSMRGFQGRRHLGQHKKRGGRGGEGADRLPLGDGHVLVVLNRSQFSNNSFQHVSPPAFGRQTASGAAPTGGETEAFGGRRDGAGDVSVRWITAEITAEPRSVLQGTTQTDTAIGGGVVPLYPACPDLQRTRLSPARLRRASITVRKHNGSEPLQGQSPTLTRLC
ncbi:hypothetical protein EYF80_048393 [Liparis tanakae]|uniref:Uncharacterized protein n=1 Tax=Liparis tanakae TaxID=230148 RepID=A0A4Z2FKB5_9TELE|nr:hypothetical protein EYF80_048393 [Liparis tanakae]